MKTKIVDKIIKNKYYWNSLDCIRDISLVIISNYIRFLNTYRGYIEEQFINFLTVEKKSAESVTNYIITELAHMGISFRNYRGQKYDNGANTHGEKSYVQKVSLKLIH